MNHQCRRVAAGLRAGPSAVKLGQYGRRVAGRVEDQQRGNLRLAIVVTRNAVAGDTVARDDSPVWQRSDLFKSIVMACRGVKEHDSLIPEGQVEFALRV